MKTDKRKKYIMEIKVIIVDEEKQEKTINSFKLHDIDAIDDIYEKASNYWLKEALDFIEI